MKKLYVISVALVMLSSSWFVHAQEEKKGVTALEEVVVTATRVEEKKKEITTNVTVIDEEEIRRSSAKDLGDLFAEKSIGHIQKYPGALTSFGIRGFRTEALGNDLEGYVLVLVNGRRAGTGNVAKIITKNIERIEIIRGPASVQYGSAAIGGVVNVITKQGKGKPSVFVEGTLGSFGYEEGSAGFAGKLEGFDFSGSFTRATQDDYDTADSDKYENTGYHNMESVSLNLGYAFLPGNRVGMIYNSFDMDRAGNPDLFNDPDIDDYRDSSNRSVDFVYDGGTSGGLFSWKGRYFEGKDKEKWVDPPESDPGGFDDGIADKQKTDQKGAQAQVSLNWRDAVMTAGFDWVNYKIETSWDPKKSEYDNPAYFLMAKTKLFDQRFIISGGLRYDEYEVELKKGQGGKEDDHNLSPRFGLAYLVTDALKLRANYGEAFKMPSANQLAGDYVSWWTHYVGNPDLDPEKSKTVELGLDFSYTSFNSSLTYFHTDFRDKVQTTSTPAGDITYENLGKAEIEGFEGELSYDIGATFEWNFELKPYVSFVYLTKYRDKEEHEDLKYTSDLHISYGITLSDFKGFSANLNVAYTGEQDIDDWESGVYPTPVIEKNDFTVANLTLTKQILNNEKFGGVTLRGEIQNLFNKDYEYVQGYPMPGRSFFLGLKYAF